MDLLHTVRHGTGALVYSKYQREATFSLNVCGYNFQAIVGGVPWFLCSTAVTMQLSHLCRNWVMGLKLNRQ